MAALNLSGLLLRILIPAAVFLLVLGFSVFLAVRAIRELRRRWQRGPTARLARVQAAVDAVATAGTALFIERDATALEKRKRRVPSNRLSSTQRWLNAIATGGWTLLVEDQDQDVAEVEAAQPELA